EYFPLRKEVALKKGFGWRDEVLNSRPVSKDRSWDVPDNIKEVSDDILDQVFICEVSGKPFKLQKAELKFYRQMGLPIPTKSPKVRYTERQNKKSKRVLYQGFCDNCEQKVSSVYPESFEGKVLCEDCYLKVVN
ncbi:MAG TPA: hypothetical protein VIT68_04750, partial [Candidatus Gracilibacteria bacterium]